MATARFVRSGKMQTLILPKEFHFTCSELEILRKADDTILREKQNPMVRAFEILASLPDDVEIRPRLTDQVQVQPKAVIPKKSRNKHRR